MAAEIPESWNILSWKNTQGSSSLTPETNEKLMGGGGLQELVPALNTSTYEKQKGSNFQVTTTGDYSEASNKKLKKY